MKQAEVLIQAGHEGRTHGKQGATSKWGKEIEWTPIVADEATRILREANVSVIREDAFLDEEKYKVKLALFIHFDGSEDSPCSSRASIGYDDISDKPAAVAWKKLYSKYWKFGWMPDNFTNNLRGYYGYRYTVTSDAELVLELGEITCEKQALWLKPRLKWLGKLIAHFVSVRISKGDISEPFFVDSSPHFDLLTNSVFKSLWPGKQTSFRPTDSGVLSDIHSLELNTNFTEDNIQSILKEYEEGREIVDLCEEYKISKTMLLQWCRQYKDTEVAYLMEIRFLQEENHQLKQMFSDLCLEFQMIKGLI